MKKVCLLVICWFFLVFTLSAQDCGTVISPTEAKAMEKMLEKNAAINTFNSGRMANVLVDIPLKFHIFRRSDGSGGLSQDQINDLIDQVNDFYIQSDMRFFQIDAVNYIDDDDVFNFNADNEGQATIGNTTGNVVNVYLFNSIVSGGRPLCGYTRFPPSADRVFAVYSCVTGGNTTLEHELGHYFTLYHTHGTTNVGTTDELVNQSNCNSAGDRLCDTPADPNLSGVVNNDCAYVGNAVDANGDFYNPDPSNIMSYAPDRCAERFSVDQYQRIRNGFENGRANLAYTSEGFIATFESNMREICVGESATFDANAFGATEYNWEFEGGIPATSSSENPEILYNSSGQYKVTLTVSNNAGQSFKAEKVRYIKVLDPSIGSINDEFSDSFDNPDPLTTKFTVGNSDNAFTFEKRTLMLNDSPVGSVFVNNFNYVTDALPQIDELSTFSFDNVGISQYSVDLDYAYNYRTVSTGLGSQIVADTFRIEVGNECNNNFQIIYSNGGESLATGIFDTDIEFFPSNISDFRNLRFDFVPDDNAEFLLFKFKNVSYNGNNLFIKNIKIIPDFSLVQPSNFRFVEVKNDSLVFRWLDNSSNEIGFLMEESRDGIDFDKSYEIESERQLFKLSRDLLSGKFFRLKAIGVRDFESDYTEIIELEESVLSLNNGLVDKITISPNPVSNLLHLKIDGTIEQSSYAYSIYSLEGGILESGFFYGNKVSLNLDKISSGIIFLNVSNTSTGLNVTKKIIKL